MSTSSNVIGPTKLQAKSKVARTAQGKHRRGHHRLAPSRARLRGAARSPRTTWNIERVAGPPTRRLGVKARDADSLPLRALLPHRPRELGANKVPLLRHDVVAGPGQREGVSFALVGDPERTLLQLCTNKPFRVRKKQHSEYAKNRVRKKQAHV